MTVRIGRKQFGFVRKLWSGPAWRPPSPAPSVSVLLSVHVQASSDTPVVTAARRQATERGLDESKPFSEIPKASGLPVVGPWFEYIRNGGQKNLHLLTAQRHDQLGPIYRENATVYLADLDTFRDATTSNKIALFNDSRAVDEVVDRVDHTDLTMNTLKECDQLFDETEEVINEQLNKWHEISLHSGGRIQSLDVRINELTLGMLASFLMGKTYSNRYASRLEKDAAKIFYLNDERRKVNKLLPTVLTSIETFRSLGRRKHFQTAEAEIMRICEKWSQLVSKDFKSSGKDGYLQMLAQSMSDLNRAAIPEIVLELITDNEKDATIATWILYAMAQNPTIQDKIVREMRDVCGEEGKKLSSHHLEKTSLLRACVKEVMRLYPAEVFSRRIAMQDCIIAGYQIPSHCEIVLNIFACSRNPKPFPNPTVFWPERWNSKQFGAIHPYINFCWGMEKSSTLRQASLVRLWLFLGRFLQEFHVRCDPVQPALRNLLLPDKDMNLRIAKRP